MSQQSNNDSNQQPNMDEIMEQGQLVEEEYYEEEYIEVDDADQQHGERIHYLQPGEEPAGSYVDGDGQHYVVEEEIGVGGDPHSQEITDDGRVVQVVRQGQGAAAAGQPGGSRGVGTYQVQYTTVRGVQKYEQVRSVYQPVPAGGYYTRQTIAYPPQQHQSGYATRSQTRGGAPPTQHSLNGGGPPGGAIVGATTTVRAGPYAIAQPVAGGGGGGVKMVRGPPQQSPLLSSLAYRQHQQAQQQAGTYTTGGGSILTAYLGGPAKNKPRKSSSKKKPCNCTKSQCLKLYCECFANGEFCLDCNCKDCHNNIEHQDERSRAIRSSLERNPHAFKPKIGVAAKSGRTLEMERQHQKGCHCKKSNCLKNYCECYEAKVPCTEKCKCCSCRNTEEDRHHKNKFGSATGGLAQLAAVAAADARSGTPFSDDESDAGGAGAGPEPVNPQKQPWTYMTEEVAEAITTCLVAMVQEMEESHSQEELEQSVLKEFGRCLELIIENANSVQPQQQQ